ncbi:G-type lectin S-receptor-like serine/threonine-protein kinase RKS1 [Morus notabilis]|uniref:G-type lectin S-receptor-like serine/threonine-protein kinase RKS1 n=1 Tax=Morus notabilis TaxID=981085 RepID=UPI000CED3592|nr:G-type lectin S-receptor-like serine/threonine-protein kinase RKS1 [Morus notabilis]
MASEYAMEGLFSTKSDVWDLCREGRASEVVDPFLDEAFVDEALRYIQIGLLSVQEHAKDRPTMSAVVLMLGNDSALPSPKQPAFILNRRWVGTGDLASSEGVNYSINFVTCTMVEAR